MTTNNFASFLQRKGNKITRVLIYAFLEWTLISLLLLNSIFSILIHKFAIFFGLKPPCIFCSRFDLQTQKTDVICEKHAAEISKIGYCTHHGKLLESQSLCVSCSTVVVDADDDGDGGDLKRCSCCDGIIKVSSLDRNSNQRGEVSFDSDAKSGYQILDDDDDDDDDDGREMGVGLEAEKEPLLKNEEDEEEDYDIRNLNVTVVPLQMRVSRNPLNKDDEDEDDDINNKEIVVSDENLNLCPDMLPKHLEFYIDHDDYRLIPVDLVNSKGVIMCDEEDSKEFELILEGDELLCGFKFISKENLPSIQEEEDELHKVCLEDEEEEEKMGISQPREDELHKVCLEDEEEEDNLGISQHLEEESMFQERNFANLQEQEEEKMGISQPREDESMIQDRSFASLQEQEEEKMGISQPHEDESMIQDRNCTHLEEQPHEEDKIVISQLHEDEIMSDERSLLTIQEEDEEDKMVISQPYTEENMIEERILATLQEQEEEEKDKIVISQPRIEENKIEEILNTLQDQEEEYTIVISQPCIIEENKIEERTLAILQDREEEEKDKIVISQPEIEVQEEDMVTEQTEMSSSPSDAKQTEEGEIISEQSLNINVCVSQNEFEDERIPETPTSVDSMHKKSIDGSVTSELECGDGTTTIEKLSSELQSEKKILRALYKELEEERSASAIAANHTMAMMNRLQEEKATMQMEALQYQRMLEEQSEYDQEALQMMNELMVKREREKQELEKDIEVLRKKVADYEERERVRVSYKRKERRNSSASCSYGEESDGLSIDLNHEAKDHEEKSGGTQEDTPTEAILGLQESLSGFEEERQAILEQLKALEEKLFTLAEEEEEEEHVENIKPLEQFYEENDNNGFSHANGKHQLESRLNGSMQKRLLPLFDATELMESHAEELEAREEGFDYLESNKSPIVKFELEKKRLAIEEEVDLVYERLQALEADREFLKHCIGSLRKGDKGLDLLQEILQHLRDLKSVELQAMKNMDHCASA